MRQAWLSRRYLLIKMAESGYSVDNYLHEKQMSMLDALDEDALKTKRARKPKAPKAVKEPKPKTWEVSFALFKQGKKMAEIAQERGLTMSTIFSHLTRYLEAGQLSMNDLVPESHQQLIEALLSKHGLENGLAFIKEQCPPDVTYDEIRLVVQHYLAEKQK
jgi:uncharacterized protein YpbB